MSFLFFFLLSTAQAGYLKMVSKPDITIKSINQQLFLTGSYQIVNEGNEEAIDVYPEIKIDRFTWKGSTENLLPGRGVNWNVHAPLHSLCTRVGPECPVALPSVGDFLIEVDKNYSDLNSYQFSVPETLIVSTSTTPSLALQIDLQIHPLDHHEFAMEYHIKNLTEQKLKINLRPLLPAEVKLLSPTFPIELPANGEMSGHYDFKNEKGLPGSHYVAYLAAEWAEKGQRRSSSAFVTFQIPQAATVSGWSADQKFLLWLLWFTSVLVIILWALWIRPLRKLRKSVDY